MVHFAFDMVEVDHNMIIVVDKFLLLLVEVELNQNFGLKNNKIKKLAIFFKIFVIKIGAQIFFFK